MMNYNKVELLEAIEFNNEAIKVETEAKKKAEKILSMIYDLSVLTQTNIYTLADIEEVISIAEIRIEEAKTRNSKRKKQLKLLEQMEALESEVVGD